MVAEGACTVMSSRCVLRWLQPLLLRLWLLTAPPCLQYARIIQKLGFEAQFQDFKIQNVVASCDVKFPIRLEGLAFAHGLFCSVRAPVRSTDPSSLSTVAGS